MTLSPNHHVSNETHDLLSRLLKSSAPMLALAPMQDVTDLPFIQLIARYGAPDIFFTEYFRVYPHSCLDKNILVSVTEHGTGRPIVAQMIGNDIESLVRSAEALQRYPVAGVDLNLGCPAPVVYRKCAGGGLLREPERVDKILGALRHAIQKVPFTVKTRIGFEDDSLYAELLSVFNQHQLDLVTVHGRTVKEGYRSEVHYDRIAMAVSELDCPVLANGNVSSANQARQVLEWTGARGLMVGRGAIRNPWIFNQIRASLAGETFQYPCGKNLLDYVYDLYDALKPMELKERFYVRKLKKYMNYIGNGIEPTGDFLHRIRRVETEHDFFQVCKDHLDHEEPLKLEPFMPATKSEEVSGQRMI